MKKILLTIMLCMVVSIVYTSQAFCAQKLLDYGFEDWGGAVASTPGYIYTSTYESYAQEHQDATEVITSYTANEMGQTWTAHGGTYFLIQNDSPDYALNPSIPGITGGDVNSHNILGLDADYGGQSDFSIANEVTTGEIFFRVWARQNKGWSTIDGGGKNKWIRVYAKGRAVDDTVYMHLTTDSTSPQMFFYCSGEPGYWLPSESGPILTNAYDGNWHKYSLYINYNTGIIRGWYDVDVETAENVTKEYIAADGQLGNAVGPDYIVLHSNFSAKYPTEETYCAIDDIEVWDGMPDSAPAGSSPLGVPADLSVEEIPPN